MLKKLSPYLEGYRKAALIPPLVILFEVILEILIPYRMAKLIDVGIARQDMTYILQNGAMMVGMALGAMTLGAIAGRYAAVTATGFAANLREALFTRIQGFSMAEIERFGTPSLITRLTTDVVNMQNVFMMTIRILVRAPIMLISATAIAIYINRRLALVFLVAAPLMAIALALISAQAFPRFQALLRQYDRLNAYVQENLSAIRTVKAYVQEDHASSRFAEAAGHLRELQMKAEKLVVMTMPLLQFAMYGCMVAIAWFGGRMIMAGTMQTGEFMSFLSYIGQILFSLMMVAMVFVNIVISRASIVRVLEVLDTAASVVEKADAQSCPACPAAPASSRGTASSGVEVAFRDVFFRYGEKDQSPDVLSGVDLTIGAGETVAILGGTGSGKSTLVQLIPRIYDVASGSVCLNGVDVRDLSAESLAETVAIVFQKDVLFSGTIRDNLLWGNPEANDEEIRLACRAAAAESFIEAFPDGGDTVLGQGGVNLSGGQKQRLCIARALLRKPRVIILDDSTSAVDTATERQIRANLKNYLKDVTTIWITQRIGTAKQADWIILLESGGVAGTGTHEDLSATNAIYREVLQSQATGGETA